jgi:TonB family protein
MRIIVAALCLLLESGVASYGQTLPYDVPPSPTGVKHSCIQYFPREAERKGIVGATSIGFRITTAGTVKGIVVVASSGSDVLDAATISCASNWLYIPAIKSGVPIEIPWAATARYAISGLPAVDTPRGSFTDDACWPDITSARLQGKSGVTIVTYALSGGQVSRVALKTSSGDASLDQLAVTCMQGAKFATTLFDGTPATGNETAIFDWKNIVAN